MNLLIRKIRRTILLLVLLYLLYLIIGAVAPFLRYPAVSEETKADFSTDKFYQEGSGADRVMLLETNESALTERLTLINQAKERIIISTFDMRSGESTKDILALLLHKADEGVQVEMLVDGFSSLAHMNGKDIFYAFSAHPNVTLKVYNPVNLCVPWKTQGRMHDKYIIVDDLGYILGGRNMFDYFIGSYPTDSRSYDREVLVYNTSHDTAASSKSSLFQVKDYFEKIFKKKDCRLFGNDPKLLEKKKVKKQTDMLTERYLSLLSAYSECFETPDYEAVTVEAGKIQLISNPTTLYAKEPVVFYTLSELMKNAREEVIIHTPYAVFNSYMYDTMAEITENVPVTLLLNARENGDNLFGSSDYTYNRSKILATGVSLYEYSQGLSYHGKSLVIDEELSIIGSYNMDLRSTYLDTELMLSIQSPALAKELKSHMEVLQKDCRIVHPDGTETVPDHVTIASVSPLKQVIWHVIGFVMKPFRFLI